RCCYVIFFNMPPSLLSTPVSRWAPAPALMVSGNKTTRAGAVQLRDSYVLARDGEAWLEGAHIAPLASASTHVTADPVRPRKLLLHAKEIARLAEHLQQKGYACVATALYWKGKRVKCEIALARGKRHRDKRATVKDRDWKRQQERLLKRSA
ncbi:MAG: SsrA-binding protein SmpB, partial [Gammaproteobacteria bacterium]|nr:SsrA-binding protein SmpB [Gammaproteobacteria bacterium]